MIYGDEKIRQMARSILPSTRRKAARYERVTLNRRVRRKVAMDCHRSLLDEAFAEEGFVYDREPYFRRMVRDRQEADKLSHFEKWALDITKDIEGVDARYAYMRSILPAGLLRWHAMSHLENYDAFERNSTSYRHDRITNLPPRPTKKERHARRTSILYDIVSAGGGHKLLNRYLIQKHRRVEWTVGYEEYVEHYKEKFFDSFHDAARFKTVTLQVGPHRPRLLRGMGDIESFISDLAKARRVSRVKVEPFTVRDIRKTWAWGPHMVSHCWIYEYKREYRENPGHHGEWWKAMSNFLDAWETHKGDITAVRNSLKIYA